MSANFSDFFFVCNLIPNNFFFVQLFFFFNIWFFYLTCRIFFFVFFFLSDMSKHFLNILILKIIRNKSLFFLNVSKIFERFRFLNFWFCFDFVKIYLQKQFSIYKNKIYINTRRASPNSDVFEIYIYICGIFDNFENKMIFWFFDSSCWNTFWFHFVCFFYSTCRNTFYKFAVIWYLLIFLLQYLICLFDMSNIFVLFLSDMSKHFLNILILKIIRKEK